MLNDTFYEQQIFELAPIAMWIEDFSEVKKLFDQWRNAGVGDIRAFLYEDPERVKTCSRAIKVLKVNQKTLSLFEADSTQHLAENIRKVFRDDMFESHIVELAQVFDGQMNFSSETVNYTLSGKRLDIQLRGSVMPGFEESLGRVLLTTEDVTEREDARRREREQTRYAKGLFEHSPVSLWVEDFSRIRILLNDLRERGIVNLRVFIDVHPEFVRQCMAEIRVIDINQATLTMFRAPDRETLLKNQHAIFRNDVQDYFKEQLIDLWEGQLLHTHEVMNYALDGSERFVLLQFSVFPGHEDDWSLVQVSLTDITARKKAEAYLEYLGKHDVLTKLYNRAFFIDEINRQERKSVRPVGIIIIDLNGLKEVNDTLGHDAGDSLLRRLGEVLNESISEPGHAARIGGDEFAVILPGASQDDAEAALDDIDKVLAINNQFYSNMPISISSGIAISQAGESIESAVRRADTAMYREKRRYYTSAKPLDGPSEPGSA